MIGKLTATEFSTMIANGINDRDQTIDTAIGSVRDLYIDPPAEVFEAQNDRIVYVNNLASLRYVEKLVPDDVDDIVFNEAIIRWDGSRSIAIVTFARTQTPTANLTVPVNFPLSTLVDPSTGVSINFRTIETQTMFFASPDAYYNAETEKYELDVLAASVSVGSETAVGSHTIKNMRRSLPGFDEVTNKSATTSGRGTETNREIADRYLLHVEGTNIGTPNGIKKYILNNFSTVSDAYIVYGEDTYLTREQSDAGPVDIWIMGSSPVERTYTTSFPGVLTLIEVDRQPLISIKSVTTTGGTTFTEGTDFEVITGQGEYSYSNRGSDGIRFLSSGSYPTAINDPVYIVYEYNSLITTLTSFFTQPEWYSMGMDRLFRWAQAEYTEIESNLKVNAGNPNTIMSLVRTRVLDYINNLKLGIDVEEFDIDSEVSKIYGVDNWTYETLAVLDGSGVADLSIGPNKYAYINDTDLVINLVS